PLHPRGAFRQWPAPTHPPLPVLLSLRRHESLDAPLRLLLRFQILQVLLRTVPAIRDHRLRSLPRLLFHHFHHPRHLLFVVPRLHQHRLHLPPDRLLLLHHPVVAHRPDASGRSLSPCSRPAPPAPASSPPDPAPSLALARTAPSAPPSESFESPRSSESPARC